MPSRKHCHRGPGRVPFGLVALFCAGATVLVGCSSTDDQSPGPHFSSNGTRTPTSDEQRQEQEKRKQEEKEREKHSGDFSNAGRLSDGFSGVWPFNYTKGVANPSSKQYVGTISVVDCTPGEQGRAAIPRSRTVYVPPQQTVKAEFSFSDEGVRSTRQTRLLCVTLSDNGGTRDTTTDEIDAQVAPQPEPDTTQPNPNPTTEPVTPSPTQDSTPPPEPEPDASDTSDDGG